MSRTCRQKDGLGDPDPRVRDDVWMWQISLPRPIEAERAIADEAEEADT